MNTVFLAIVLIAFAAAAWGQFTALPAEGAAAPMEALSKAMVQSAAGAVDLSLGLVGVMTLFLGLMKVAEAGGLLRIIAQLIRPLMVRLFPDVPGDHPAMGAMILNLSANVMGLGNAATPFGIRAMQELNRLNPAAGHRHRRHGALSGHQHLERDAAADRRHRPARGRGLGRPGRHFPDDPVRHRLFHPGGGGFCQASRPGLARPAPSRRP